MLQNLKPFVTWKNASVNVCFRNKPQILISDECKEHSFGKARILNTFVCVL